MNQRSWERSYGSHREFYEHAYGQHISAVRPTGRLGATLIEARQSAGDWSDAPTPDLVVGWLPSPSRPVGATIDLGAGRFSGRQQSNDAILVAPGSGTSILIEGAHTCRVLAVPYRALKDLAAARQESLPEDGDFGPLHAGFLRDARLTKLLDDLWREVEEDGAHGSLFVDAYLLQLAGLLLRMRNGAGSASELRSGGLAPWQVRRVVECLEEHLAGDIPLAALAQLACLSPNHFCTAFRISLGEPPHRYLVRRRIERAKELLADPRLSVTDVALAVGFSSSAHFATAFRKQVGVTPSAYSRERLL